MTVKKIVDGIAEILHTHYPNNDIYTEDVEQGLTTPCFFVFPISVSDLRHIGKRRLASYSMCVQYIPDSDEPKAECSEVEEKLYKLLEYITVDGVPVGCSEPHSETNDDVLSFFADYGIFTLEIDSEMQIFINSYSDNYNVKG